MDLDLLLILWTVILVTSMNTIPEVKRVNNFIMMEKRWIEDLGVIKVKRNNTDQLIRQHEDQFSTLLQIKDRSDYLGNLLNLFSIVRRLTKVWPVTLALVRANFGNTLKVPRFSVPDKDLWDSGVVALVRVQEIYNISTETLVSGNMEGTYSHAKLTAGDCFGVALFYYKLKHHERAVEWLVSALQISHQDHSVSRHRILEYLHLAQCFKGDQKGSIATHRELRMRFPLYTPLEELALDYTLSSNQSCRETAVKIKEILYDNNKLPHNVEESQGLCQKKLYTNPSAHHLRCRLVHYNHTYLRIRPFKVEELHLDPPLLVFYDVIYESEIEHFKTSYHEKMKHAATDYDDGRDYYQDTQYTLWIEEMDPDDKIRDRISRRAVRIANQKVFELVGTMLASYGVAGEIKLHKDIIGPPSDISENDSRRDYVTVMFYVKTSGEWDHHIPNLQNGYADRYILFNELVDQNRSNKLNDVTEGGYTIFPAIQKAVIPVKSAAAMWYNRYSEESTAHEMQHSGCPILRGTKWIITEWLYDLGQKYPTCDLGEETSHKYFYL